MAFLRKYISKATFGLISVLSNSAIAYLSTTGMFGPPELVLITAVVNAVVVWLGVESGHGEETEETE